MRLAGTVGLLAAASVLLASDAEEGKRIFEGKGRCLTCHSIEKRGGSLGPDLSAVGLARTPQSLRLALTNPSAEIFDAYLALIVETTTGERIEGITLNEDDI